MAVDVFKLKKKKTDKLSQERHEGKTTQAVAKTLFSGGRQSVTKNLFLGMRNINILYIFFFCRYIYIYRDIHYITSYGFCCRCVHRSLLKENPRKFCYNGIVK